jgi:hypothetical protein
MFKKKLLTSFMIIEETQFDGSSRYFIQQHVKKWSWTKFKYVFVWEHAKTWMHEGFGYYYYDNPTEAQLTIDELINESKKAQFKPIRKVYTD